jgi:xylulokinase
MMLLASVLGKALVLHRGAEKGPAFGAARLARLATTGETVAEVCTKPAAEETIAPDRYLTQAYAERLPRFRSLYAALRPEFRLLSGSRPN